MAWWQSCQSCLAQTEGSCRICRIHPNQLPKSLVTRGSDDRDASASEHAEQEEIVGMLKSGDRKNVDLLVRRY